MSDKKTEPKVKKEKDELPKIDPKDTKIEELTHLLQRVQADFENYKKKCDKDYKAICKRASADTIFKLLPLLDSFELALKNTEKHEDFVKGVELIYSQLFSLLEQNGVKPIKALGERFDPYKHEVLLHEESDKKEDTVLEELQKGYMLNDMVLRTTKVKISKGKGNDHKKHSVEESN